MQYPIEQTDAREMIMPAVRICARCGATIASRLPGNSCGACLLETALDSPGETAPSPGRIFPARTMDFGDYELVEEIGRGGQGVVFRARQKSLNRTVALKVIALGPWATEVHLKRFRREAEAAASLEHPRIVPIYEIGERDGACYFSMKCVDGGQLDAVVRREPMALRQAVELIVKLARTVHYAHERGILHRDIKPGNILLDAEGEPHLTDFGLARLVETESTVTGTMEVLGTPSYMAPEEAAGQTKELTAATDVYGLGAVLYQLLTAHPPFAGGTTYETIRMVLETEPRKPRLWNSKVDLDLETICLKCLEKDPQRRYPSALALAQDIERWLRHEPIQARRTGVFSRAGKWVRRNPAVTTLAAVIIALAVAIGMISWRTFGERLPQSGIAVLPFENLSDDKTDASFVDGIQDDILTKLAKIGGLKVISRTSVMQYRGEQNVRKIADALRVSHVLEGSVRKTGDKVHLNAQLIDARTDNHVWAEQYEGDLTDVFALQSEIAQKIANQLSTNISLAEKKALASKPTQNLDAYDLYVRAKAIRGVYTPDDPRGIERVQRAIELLEEAVRRDPNFALAYCSLAELNLNLFWLPGRVDPSRLERAKVALDTARRLAPDAGETHLAQALFYHYGQRDYDHALEELDVAARLLPNNPDVFSISAKIERRLGRWADALRHFAKASELDPRDSVTLAALAQTYMLLRHYSEAERIADHGIKAFPDAAEEFWDLKGELALAQCDMRGVEGALTKVPAQAYPSLRFRWLLYTRNLGEAERFASAQWLSKDESYVRWAALWSASAARARGDAEKARSYLLIARRAFEPLLRDPPNPNTLSFLGIIDAGLGRRDDALREARRAVELRPLSKDALEAPEYITNLALVYAWTGDHEHAIEQLLSVSKLPNGPTFGDLKFDPAWDNLRDDPRFARILAEAAKPIPLK